MKNYILAALVIVAVASCSKKTSTATKTVTTDAVTLFQNNCAKCHGGNGVEGKSPKLNQVMQKGDVIGYINNGHGKMPAFKDKLSSSQIDAIAGLVLTLQKKNSGK